MSLFNFGTSDKKVKQHRDSCLAPNWPKGLPPRSDSKLVTFVDPSTKLLCAPTDTLSIDKRKLFSEKYKQLQFYKIHYITKDLKRLKLNYSALEGKANKKDPLNTILLSKSILKSEEQKHSCGSNQGSTSSSSDQGSTTSTDQRENSPINQ